VVSPLMAANEQMCHITVSADYYLKYLQDIQQSK